MAGKKTGNWIFILGVAAVVAFNILDSGNGKQTNQSVSQNSGDTWRVNTLKQDKLDSYALKGIRNDWPNMTDPAAVNQQDKLAKNYYVILDDSGSMESGDCARGYTSKLNAAIDALAAFAEGLPPQANLGVMSFNMGKFNEQLPLGKHDTNEIHNLSKRMKAKGNTPLATAITRGYEALRKQARSQLGYGEYHLVVITDGEATEGEYPDRIITQILSESPLDVHTIGFCIGTEHVLNQPRYLSYQAADNAQALRQGLQDVLAESPAFAVSSFK
jgi:Ca-activated chloride channel homolog